MPFQKGKTTNPKGRTDGPVREAIAIVLNEPVSKKDKVKKLRRIVEAVAKNAMLGDIQAARELFDRLDGKPTQVVAGDADGGAIKHTVKVEFIDPETEK